MTHYVLGRFREAPDLAPVSAGEAERIRVAHLATLRRLEADGSVMLSGSVEAGDVREAIVIFVTESVERARQLVADDPAIVSGRLVLDVYTWNGPARG